ncbi:thiopurine S-methyltransferase [Bordetella genomosp. 8]|uniref:Thiopurine S-methyltransferase n=1 Tax=Bordetella genomosp. 8 TaxID=1416806 RepID=A0A1W6YQJ2_9BORD|nr:thiopurine S-methyltransferase [Bordetella genomosp. 8]ARP82833.1 thiopurine S-methyltransferase [Bordetella genomosp. 8]
MEPEFWLERWREGRTHFHQTRISPPLERFWPTLEFARGSRVLVPLCGKSLDMLWLAERGLHVLGVELSPLAVQQFFDEHGLAPRVRRSALGEHYSVDYGASDDSRHGPGHIEIIRGDIFDLDADTLRACAGVFDRAALVALPRDMREPYVRHIYGQLADDYQGLLVTLDYPQAEMDGPPFCVDDEEVQALYAGHSVAELIYRRDILALEPKFQKAGVSRLDALAYRLRRRR